MSRDRKDRVWDAPTQENPTIVDDLAKTREGVASPRLAVLDAGSAVFSDHGFARASVEEICHRAGVGLDVFYAHFQDRAGLLRALSDRFVDEMCAAIDEQTAPGVWKGADARALMRIATRAVIETVLDRRGLVRALLSQGPNDTSLPAGLRRIGAHLVDRTIESLKDGKDGARIEPRMASFALLLTVSIAHHDVLVGNEWSGEHFTREELIEETTHAACAYLGI